MLVELGVKEIRCLLSCQLFIIFAQILRYDENDEWRGVLYCYIAIFLVLITFLATFNGKIDIKQSPTSIFILFRYVYIIYF